jgi:hypothetical protein
MGRGRQHELVVLLHRDGKDIRALPLIQCRPYLERVLAEAEIACLLLVEVFDCCAGCDVWRRSLKVQPIGALRAEIMTR